MHAGHNENGVHSEYLRRADRAGQADYESSKEPIHRAICSRNVSDLHLSTPKESVWERHVHLLTTQPIHAAFRAGGECGFSRWGDV
jgi:hypothetical protein